jgi:hypothetical protein
MPAVGHLGDVADSLGSLGEVAERHFAAIGHSLEEAVGILAALTATFQTLLGELRASELVQSGQDLAFVAASVAALAATAQTDVATLRRVAGVAEAIEQRIARMHAVLREVDILAMNARLVAGTMGEAGSGFLPFAAEIRRSAGEARGGLDRLAQELADAKQHLQVAGQAAGAFVAQFGNTMQLIIGHLTASVVSIEVHGAMSGDAASVVGTRSDQIRGRVAAAIMSLQLGDITRQRIEHMHSACHILSREAVPSALGYRLVAAQLLDAAEELERGAGCIVEELKALVVDAGDIARLGNQAYGSSDRGQGSFLDELEADRHQAEVMFGHLRAAHATVNPRIAAVLRAADRLVGHVATIRSVEADIHIMGINTSLKCGRLGVVGRPLSVISHAVRDCGRQTAQHAAGVLEAMQHLLADTGSLAAADAAQGVDAIDTAAQRMTNAVGCLGETGHRMREALRGLAGDGETVARLLGTAVEGFAAQREISAALRKAAAACTELATQAVDDGLAEAVPAQIAASYTMARERMVHARVVPPLAGQAVDELVRAMAGADLPGADLPGADLAGADLADANRADANRADAELADPSLADAALADMLF